MLSKNNIQDMFVILNTALNLNTLIKGHTIKYDVSIFITILCGIELTHK